MPTSPGAIHENYPKGYLDRVPGRVPIVAHPSMTPGNELDTVTSAVSLVIPLVVVKASGSPSMLVKLLATALTAARVSTSVSTSISTNGSTRDQGEEASQGISRGSVYRRANRRWSRAQPPERNMKENKTLRDLSTLKTMFSRSFFVSRVQRNDGLTSPFFNRPVNPRATQRCHRRTTFTINVEHARPTYHVPWKAEYRPINPVEITTGVLAIFYKKRAGSEIYLPKNSTKNAA